MSWPSPKKYNLHPLIGQPPWNQKKFDLPQKPKILKLQLLTLTIVEGAHYVIT